MQNFLGLVHANVRKISSRAREQLKKGCKRKDILVNMDFEKLLEQEARKAARQDYEEVTEKTKIILTNIPKRLSRK